MDVAAFPAAVNTPLVLAVPEQLAAYTTPASDLTRLREPVLAIVPYGVGSSTRGQDVFVLLGNGGRVALRRVHTLMTALQSNRVVLAEHHLGLLAEVWADASRLLQLYLAVADRVWAGWVSAADKRAAVAAASPVAPVAGALGRLEAALAAANGTWAGVAASGRPDRQLPGLWAALHAVSGATVAAFGRVEALLPAHLRDGVVARAHRAARRADVAALTLATDLYGSRAVAVAAVTAWMPSGAWADYFARVFLRGGGGRAAAERTAAAAARAAASRRAAEVGEWAAAMVARPTALPAGMVPAADPARMGAMVLPSPVAV